MKLSFSNKLWLILTIGLASGWYVDHSILTHGGYKRLKGTSVEEAIQTVAPNADWIEAARARFN